MRKCVYTGIAASLFCSSMLLADQHEMQTPPAVMMSSPNYSFEVDFSALFMQPTGSDLHYAAEAYPEPIPSPHWQIYGIDTDYHFGFDLGIGGVFHDANTSLALRWQRLHSSDSASVSVPTTNMIGPFFEIGPDALPYKKAAGSVSFRFDEVSLLLGTYADFGPRIASHMTAGVGYVHIKQTRSTTYSSENGNTFRNINVPSEYNGAGPQFGVDFSYNIYEGFEFIGGARGSLFVGKIKNSTTYKSTTPSLENLGMTPPNTQTTSVDSSTQIVPAFETKLGLAYTCTFKEHYMFTLEAGYRAQVYFNAIQSINMGSEVITPPVEPDAVGVFARTFDQTISNFSLAGPYIMIGFGF